MSDFEHDKLKFQTGDELDEDELEDDEEDEEEEEGAEDDQDIEIEIDASAFKAALIDFPCFASVPKDKTDEETFELVYAAYQDENLLEEQDHVVELLLHLQDEDSPFNLNRALQVWSHEDRQAFLELADEICQEADSEDEEELDKPS